MEMDDFPIRSGVTVVRTFPLIALSGNGGGELYHRRRKSDAGFNYRVIDALQIDLGKTGIVQLILAQYERVIQILVDEAEGATVMLWACRVMLPPLLP